jgi:hypothetical protein
MFTASSVIDQCQQELNLIGQQVDESDILMYLSDAIDYFGSTYSLPTAKRESDITIFPNVRQYPLPSDFGRIIEPKRPPSLHSPRFLHETPRELNDWPFGRKMAVEYDRGVPFLNVEDKLDAMASLLHGCEATDGVTLSGDGSALAVDNIIYTEGLGSLRFLVTPATGSTALTFSIPSMDMTDFLAANWNFLDLISPSTNTAAIASIKLRLGSNASNYYEMTATTDMRGRTILPGIRQMGFDFGSRTQVGTPVVTAIAWMQVVIAHGMIGVSGTYRIDNIFTAQGTYFQVPYYSINNVLSAAGLYKARATLSDDTVMFPLGHEMAITYKVLELIASSPNVANQSFANYAARELKSKEDAIRSMFPVETAMRTSTWYKKGKRSTIRRF